MNEDASHDDESQGQQQDEAVSGLAPEQHEAHRELHAGDGGQQNGGEQAVVACQVVGAEVHERENEHGHPDHSGKEKLVPVQAGASCTSHISAHRCLWWCRRRDHMCAPAPAHRPKGEPARS